MGLVFAVEFVELQLWEIDENLMRSDLTELDRAQHLKRRKEIFEAKGGKKTPTLGGEQPVGFDKDTAEKTGLSKRSVHKSRTRAEKIDPAVMGRLTDPEAPVTNFERF